MAAFDADSLQREGDTQLYWIASIRNTKVTRMASRADGVDSISMRTPSESNQAIILNQSISRGRNSRAQHPANTIISM